MVWNKRAKRYWRTIPTRNAEECLVCLSPCVGVCMCVTEDGVGFITVTEAPSGDRKCAWEISHHHRSDLAKYHNKAQLAQSRIKANEFSSV